MELTDRDVLIMIVRLHAERMPHQLVLSLGMRMTAANDLVNEPRPDLRAEDFRTPSDQHAKFLVFNSA